MQILTKKNSKLDQAVILETPLSVFKNSKQMQQDAVMLRADKENLRTD